MLKRNKIGFLVIIVFLLSAIPVIGLAQTDDAAAGEQMTQDTLQMLEYVSAGDQDGVHSLVTPQVGAGLSVDVVNQMEQYLKGAVQNTAISEVEAGSLTAQSGEKLEARSAVVTVTTDQDEYRINVTQVNTDGKWLFHVFNIVNSGDYAATTPVENSQSQTIQGIMIALTVVFYAIIVWAIIVCVRAKIKLKWLWIILIVLLCICLTVASNGQTARAGISFGIYIGVFSNAQLYMNGGYQLNFLIPVGAVLFLALKKKLEKNYLEKKLMEEKMMAMASRNVQDEVDSKEENQNDHNPKQD